MFANKLVAATDRYEKKGKIAGRDFYDIYKFYMQNLPVNREVIKGRMGVDYKDYVDKLIKFVETNVTEKELLLDLNPLVKKEDISFIQKDLKPELLMLLRLQLE